MKWLVRWSHESADAVDRLDPVVAERILRAIDRLAIEGDGDIRRLVGIDPPEYRLRVSKWRIRFQIDHAALGASHPSRFSTRRGVLGSGRRLLAAIQLFSTSSTLGTSNGSRYRSRGEQKEDLIESENRDARAFRVEIICTRYAMCNAVT